MATGHNQDPIEDYPLYELEDNSVYKEDKRRRISFRTFTSDTPPLEGIKRTASLISTRTSLTRIQEHDSDTDYNVSLCSLINPSTSQRSIVTIGSSAQTSVGDTHITNVTLQGKALTALTGTTQSILDQHIQKNVFAKTKWFDAALRKLVGSKKVIILSNFGEGRTSLGLELLLKMKKEDDEEYEKQEPMIIRTANEWRSAMNSEENTAVFLDDIFGRLTLNKKRYSEWESIFPDIEACISDVNSSVYLIIAMNKYIFRQIKNRLRQNELFSNIDRYVVDISDNDREDRELIFTKQLNNPKGRQRYEITTHDTRITGNSSIIQIHERDFQNILDIPNTIAFPSCCSLYVNDETCQAQGTEFFRSPTEILYPDIETLCESDTHACLLLSLILFAKTDITPGDLFNKDMNASLIQHLGKLCSVRNDDFEYLSGKLECKMKHLRGILVENTSNKLSYISKAIQVSMIKVFGTINMKFLIEKLDFELLVKHTTSIEMNDQKVCIDDYHFDTLAQRFVHEIGSWTSSNKIKETTQLIANSEIMENGSFREQFVGHLVRLRHYKKIIQCREADKTVNLISALFQQRQSLCYKLAEEIMKQIPDIDNGSCCRSKNSSWFTKEIHRSILHAVELKDYEACSILAQQEGDLPKSLQQDIVNNGDGRIYAHFKLGKTSNSRNRQFEPTETTYMNPVLTGQRSPSRLFRPYQNISSKMWF